jgi:GNAT superfamily N-acetyltransferase
MDQRAALAAFDEQMRRNPRPSVSDGRFERAGHVVRCVGANPGDWCGIDWSELDESTADAAIAAQVAYFTELGREFEWKYYSHDHPADLPERLRRAGLKPGQDEALMIADVADVPTELALPHGIELVDAANAEAIHALVDVHDAVFGSDHGSMREALLERLASDPDSFAVVVAVAGGEPVSSARMEFHPGTEFASLWGGGTLEPWRGKGIYGALVSHRARLAAKRGYRYLRVDALPTSRPILERFGFVRLSTTVPFVFTPR